MVEGLGLAGITETPVVIYNAQRPGPATGLPTRNEQGDMLFMLHASQGEFPRFLLAPGTHEEAFVTGWRAFNLAEKYQTPVLVLSDHYLAVSIRTLEADALDFDAVEIDRGALLSEADLEAQSDPYLRFRITESGISPRALPGPRHAGRAGHLPDPHGRAGRRRPAGGGGLGRGRGHRHLQRASGAAGASGGPAAGRGP